MAQVFEPLTYRRRPTRLVHCGDVTLGGTSPIRVQSMTTPATTDTPATVAQIVRLVEAGCEIVRVTVPTSADADNLPNIRKELEARGIRVPLVADIHFTPAAALKAVEHVEKIRINPGNYADKKRFAVREYTDSEYAGELERIEKVFVHLIRRCKERGVVMRIGTNHGSLSDRIMNRYGDTPEGMVESALEFVRMCEAHDYRELVLSMKASNPVVVLQTYRLLAARMAELGMNYPFHLGVTEAGDGEDARIKSGIGIGALLSEGIGDTVRVSLTEDPVAEVPVALALVAPFNRAPRGPEPAALESFSGFVRIADPRRRTTHAVRLGPREVGGGSTVIVEVPLLTPPGDGEAIRRELDLQSGVRVPEETRAELVSVRAGSIEDLAAVARLRASMELVAPAVALSVRLTGSLGSPWSPADLAIAFDGAHRVHVTVLAPLDGSGQDALAELVRMSGTSRAALLVEAGASDGSAQNAIDVAVQAARLSRELPLQRLLLAIDPRLGPSPLHTVRALADRLAAEALDVPIVLIDRPAERGVDELLAPSAAIGGLLCEGIGDAVLLQGPDATESRRLAFGILQGARVRMTRTEFISCPSCGRTLFDLETTTARVKARTAHLKGLKIAVMGCIVNGPGEMADADFGYVGWGDEKIALFVGKDLVAKDISTCDAEDRLVELIRQHGKWVDPPVPVAEEA